MAASSESEAGETITYDLGAGRHGYLVSATGTVDVNDARDGGAITNVDVVKVTALIESEVILVDAI